ncbi:MAG: class I SAM-dependent methyltransferase [Bdellovibrionales bacterium]|nr:class I SAM-dependent methyltransferase [Bdellovibrionales bacterium]
MSHFNEQASNWDKEEKIKMMKILASKTIKALNLTQPLDIMDFGCGTGLFSLEMSKYIKSLVGIDTSEGMLEVFDKKTQGFDNINSLNIDLEKYNIQKKFNLIISSMAFHHLEDPQYMILKMRDLLSSDGRIAIVDLDKEDGSFHPNNVEMGVKHFGFSKQEIANWAEKSDMSLDYQIINTIDKNNKNYSQFLAVFSRGEK